MLGAIKYTGNNARAVCAFVVPEATLKPHALHFDCSLRQDQADPENLHFYLSLAARNGRVRVDVGDWVVREDDGGIVRLGSDEIRVEENPTPTI